MQHMTLTSKILAREKVKTEVHQAGIAYYKQWLWSDDMALIHSSWVSPNLCRLQNRVNGSAYS